MKARNQLNNGLYSCMISLFIIYNKPYRCALSTVLQFVYNIISPLQIHLEAYINDGKIKLLSERASYYTFGFYGGSTNRYNY